MLTDNALINPIPLYEGQRFVNVGNLTHGSSSEIVESAAGSIGAFSTPLSWNISRLQDPLMLGDQLIVTQGLCDFQSQPSSAQSPTVKDCASLPPPELQDPLPGQSHVNVVDPIIGSRTRFYDEVTGTSSETAQEA